ncbi:MAG: hypothetical protein LIO69_07885, partial [Oscillospiraceae bacterium]|nr:hypothetical protein [Oscillospiraceae bacterium]
LCLFVPTAQVGFAHTHQRATRPLETSAGPRPCTQRLPPPYNVLELPYFTDRQLTILSSYF